MNKKLPVLLGYGGWVVSALLIGEIIRLNRVVSKQLNLMHDINPIVTDILFQQALIEKEEQ